MSFKVGSFNVKNLSLATGRDLDRIAAIILENELDIVAMQEVLSEGKILTGINSKSVSGQAKAYDYSLKSRLGKDWGICWRDPETSAKNYPFLGGDSRGEGYAFLWNTTKFELPLNDKGSKVFPRIWRNYKTDSSSGLIRLMRDPCYGRFIVKGRPAEIRLITTHIVYGKPNADSLDIDLDCGAIEMRNHEFQILAGQIYPRISEYYKDINCTSPYTIILGDYNLNLRTSPAKKAYMPSVACFDTSGRMITNNNDSYCTIYTVQDELSTLKSNEDGFANNYDHFSYDSRVRDQIVPGSVHTINAVEQHIKDENSKYYTYRKEVSDHLPIIIEIDV